MYSISSRYSNLNTKEFRKYLKTVNMYIEGRVKVFQQLGAFLLSEEGSKQIRRAGEILFMQLPDNFYYLLCSSKFDSSVNDLQLKISFK